MDADEMAEAIAWELAKDGSWKAEFNGIGEINFENENGEKFVLTVVEVDEFPGEGE